MSLQVDAAISLRDTSFQQRLNQLLSGKFNFIITREIRAPRLYQEEILKATVRDLKSRIFRGRWDVATGAGKTYMAFCLARHIISNGGKVLFLTPGNTELNNALRAHQNYRLGHKNSMQFYHEKDFTDLADPKKERYFKNISYYYSTVQMFCFNQRYASLPKNLFDLIIFDESQGYLGKILGNPINHFHCAQIHMSATPYNMQKHVGDNIPHIYGHLTSQELIEQYGFPRWLIKNYTIEDRAPKSGLSTAEDFDFEDYDLHSCLNIGKRFSVIEKILEDIVSSPAKKGVVFMPSVSDAELFVNYIVANNPILRGKVDYVAGKRGRQNEVVEEYFRSSALKAVLSKDLWNQSLDVIEISDIVLSDPCRSLQRITQRIGRGVRPAEDKEFMTIHDLVSSTFHSKRYGEPAIRADSFAHQAEPALAQAKQNGNHKKSAAITAEDVSPQFIAALAARDFNALGLRVREAVLSEVIEKCCFMADPHWARKVFQTFAQAVFHVSYYELISNIKIYQDLENNLAIDFDGKIIQLNLAQAFSAANFYGTFEDCSRLDYISELADAVWSKNGDSSNLLNTELFLNNQPQLMPEDIGFDFNVDYVSTLNLLCQAYPENVRIVKWNVDNIPKNNPPKFTSKLKLQFRKSFKEVESRLIFNNKMHAKQCAAFTALESLSSNPVYKRFTDANLKLLNPGANGGNSSKDTARALNDKGIAEYPKFVNFDRNRDYVSILHQYCQQRTKLLQIKEWQFQQKGFAPQQKFSCTLIISFKDSEAQFQTGFVADKKLEAKQAAAFLAAEQSASHPALRGIAGFFRDPIIQPSMPKNGAGFHPITVTDILGNTRYKDAATLLNTTIQKQLVGKFKKLLTTEGDLSAITVRLNSILGQKVTIDSEVFTFNNLEAGQPLTAYRAACEDIMNKLLKMEKIRNFWARKIEGSKNQPTTRAAPTAPQL
jgi:superfamily II DNA or RNA helicase